MKSTLLFKLIIEQKMQYKFKFIDYDTLISIFILGSLIPSEIRAINNFLMFLTENDEVI